jgi:NAD(P)H-hydrate repair Nnr-like enzyme with NAD(P)H-hydrate epimerase domain
VANLQKHRVSAGNGINGGDEFVVWTIIVETGKLL